MVLFTRPSTFPNLWSYLRPIAIDALTFRIDFDPTYIVNIARLFLKHLTLRSDTAEPALVVQQPQGAVVARFSGPSTVLEIRSDGSLTSNVTIDDLLTRLYYTQARIGDLKWSANTTDWRGWLICDGRDLSVSDYPDLFQVIGTSFGGGGEGTFRLPDPSGKVLAAVSPEQWSTGQTMGNLAHTLSLGEIPSHSHTGTTGTAGSHTHLYSDAYFAEATGGVGGPKVFGTNGSCDGDNSYKWRQPDGTWSNTPGYLVTSEAGDHAHTFTTNPTGAVQPDAISLMQPTLVIGYLYIYTGRVVS